MSIDEIVEFLKKLKEERGNIAISCDFRSHDTELHYNDQLGCVFGD